MYQDTWINGQCVAKGQRECENRYNIIQNVCFSLRKGFSVLDIGANNCYFGLRLIEDFNCTVTAFEFNSFEKRNEIVKQNKTDRLLFIKRKLSIPDIKILQNQSCFDLVLALSVVHHLPGNTTEWINEIRRLGDNVVIEFALEDSSRPDIRKDYKIPEDGKIIGYGHSHLNSSIKRPIVLLK